MTSLRQKLALFSVSLKRQHRFRKSTSTLHPSGGRAVKPSIPVLAKIESPLLTPPESEKLLIVSSLKQYPTL